MKLPVILAILAALLRGAGGILALDRAGVIDNGGDPASGDTSTRKVTARQCRIPTPPLSKRPPAAMATQLAT